MTDDVIERCAAAGVRPLIAEAILSVLRPGDVLPNGCVVIAAKEEGVMDWRPIETAPRDGTRIIFWQPGRKIKVGEWLPPEKGWATYGWKCTHGNFHEPSHWMPLPTPPAATSDSAPQDPGPQT